jgi:UrcA family protein
MKNPYLIALTAGLITAGFIKAAPALAEPVGAQTYVSRVQTSDLDLSSASGTRELQQRLSLAAREVCGVASDADVAGKNDVRKCRDEALARATGDQAALLTAASRGAVLAVTAQR